MILIREAQESDAKAMARVMVDTWLVAQKGQVPEGQWHKRRDEWTYEISARGWVNTLRNITTGSSPYEIIFLAVDEQNHKDAQEVIGLVMGGPARVGPWEHAGEIYVLYILPEYQRRRIGKRLLRTAVNQLSSFGMRSLVIRVLTTNGPANQFYQSLGGQVVDEVESEDYGFREVQRVYGWEDIRTLDLMF